MKLLTHPNILKAFQEHLEKAQKIDLAIAWVTNSSALELLCNYVSQRKLKVRALVGIDTNYTQPIALQGLAKLANVRVVKSEQGIFHPKMYLFYMKRKMVVWVGSANFTDSGLNNNEELVSEFDSSHEEAKQWFEKRWRTVSDFESKKLIEEYAKTWRPVGTSNISTATRNADDSQLLSMSKIKLQCDWTNYLQQLKARDLYWQNRSQAWKYPFSVLGDSASYLETIADGHAITRYSSWDKLSYQEVVMLLGLSDEYGVRGLLGSMRGAGQVKHVFLETKASNLKIRRAILAAVQATINTTSQSAYISAAKSALEKITSHNRFGMGVATRFLALARPDMAISLNKASQYGLATFSGLAPTTLKEIRNYIKLLQWMGAQEWYVSSAPTDPWEKSIWEKRAALIDAFVYDDRI